MARRELPFIIDIAGNNSMSRLRRALSARGTLVIIRGEEGGSITGGLGRSLRSGLVSPGPSAPVHYDGPNSYVGFP